MTDHDAAPRADEASVSKGKSKSVIGRREALGVLATIPLAAAIDLRPAAIDRIAWLAQRAVESATETGKSFTPKFFTPHEWRTVRVLVDLIIPRDERSGSATEAGVPEFMDFTMIDRPAHQIPIRGGLAWLDAECERRFGKPFVACTAAEHKNVLDDLAWPSRAKGEFSQGVWFFTMFRDLTASGFWSSRMGVDDLQYRGNTVVAEWTGCPEAALKKLGVSY